MFKPKNINYKLCIFVFVLTLLNGTLPNASTRSNNMNSSIDNSASLVTQTGSNWIWNHLEVVSNESTIDSYDPKIATDNTNSIHVVWYEYSDYNASGTDADIFYKKFDSNTNIWESTIAISTESTSTSKEPSIAIDSTNSIHVVWRDSTDYNGSGTDLDVFYKKYDSMTNAWETTVLVSNESTLQSYYPKIAIDSTNSIHITWYDLTNYYFAGTDLDVFYKKFDRTTNVWETTVLISSESYEHSILPNIAIDSTDSIHIAWYDLTNYNGAGADIDIFYKKYDSNANIWGSTIVVSTESTSDSGSPSIAIDSTNSVHIAWHDLTNYNGAGADIDIFYKKYDSVTNTWESTIAISTESTLTSSEPRIAIDSTNGIHVVWRDYTNYNGAGDDEDIFYKKYDSSTNTWEKTAVVSTDIGISRIPDLAIDSSDLIHVVWRDQTDYNGSGTDYDIFYRKYFGVPSPPTLNLIEPNPSDAIVLLTWNSVYGGTSYNIYRSIYPIFEITGLNPIATVTDLYYVDNIAMSGKYYYAITGSNVIGEGEVSNTEYVFVEIKNAQERVTITITQTKEPMNQTAQERVTITITQTKEPMHQTETQNPATTGIVTSIIVTETETQTEEGSLMLNSTFVLLGFVTLIVYNFRNRRNRHNR